LNRFRPTIRVVLVSLLLIVGVPAVGSWARRNQSPRCALDGQEIVSTFAVRVTDRAGVSHRFCCVRCAERWLDRNDIRTATVAVTDEVTGAELDARAAVFVRSPVVTNRVTGNRVHAFRDSADAVAHTHEFGGRILGPGARPFVRPE
jgi:hypothetical protein